MLLDMGIYLITRLETLLVTAASYTRPVRETKDGVMSQAISSYKIP